MLFLSCLPLRLSSVRVVFSSRNSHNVVVPMSKMSFPVDLLRKELVADGYHLCICCFVFTTQIEFCECCVCH